MPGAQHKSRTPEKGVRDFLRILQVSFMIRSISFGNICYNINTAKRFGKADAVEIFADDPTVDS